jgi:imidazole glycerol-phosphate synthase subunit HisF
MNLPKRIITTLMLNNGILYRSKKFNPDYRYTLNFVDMYSVDEIVLIDISQNNTFLEDQKKLFLNELKNLSKNSFVPFSVGGGIRTLQDINFLLQNGADRVILNTAALENPKFIDEASREFGSQCIIVCIDVLKENDKYYVMKNHGKIKSNYDLKDWLKIIQENNTGEIFLQSIEHDGSLTGYDINLIDLIKHNIQIPIIISSGAGNWSHVEKVFEIENVSAASLTNIFHFTEKSLISLKTHLKEKNFYVRT